jgi:hypothetical protein
MKTLSTLSHEEWEEIRERYRVSKVLIWRAPTVEESKRHQGMPVGMRLLEDGTYEVQINADAIRCRPRAVAREQYTLYCLFCCLAHIELGHLDERRQQQWLKSRIRNGRRKGLKTLRAELDREASQWALQQLSRASLTPVDCSTRTAAPGPYKRG